MRTHKHTKTAARCARTHTDGVHSHTHRRGQSTRTQQQAGKMAAKFGVIQKGIFLGGAEGGRFFLYLHNHLQNVCNRSRHWKIALSRCFPLFLHNKPSSSESKKLHRKSRKLSRKSSEERNLFFPCCHICVATQRQTIRFHWCYCRGIVIPEMRRQEAQFSPSKSVYCNTESSSPLELTSPGVGAP